MERSFLDKLLYFFFCLSFQRKKWKINPNLGTDIRNLVKLRSACTGAALMVRGINSIGLRNFFSVSYPTATHRTKLMRQQCRRESRAAKCQPQCITIDRDPFATRMSEDGRSTLRNRGLESHTRYIIRCKNWACIFKLFN